jgi:hypothetical protein
MFNIKLIFKLNFWKYINPSTFKKGGAKYLLYIFPLLEKVDGFAIFCSTFSKSGFAIFCSTFSKSGFIDEDSFNIWRNRFNW